MFVTTLLLLAPVVAMVSSQRNPGYQNTRVSPGSSGSTIGVGNENFGTSNDNSNFGTSNENPYGTSNDNSGSSQGTANNRYGGGPNSDRYRPSSSTSQGTRNEGMIYGSSGTYNENTRPTRAGSDIGVGNEAIAATYAATRNEGSHSHHHGHKPGFQNQNRFGTENENSLVRPTQTGTAFGVGNENFGTSNDNNNQNVLISTVTLYPQRDGYTQTITVSQPASTYVGIFAMQSTAFLPKFATDFNSRGSNIGIRNEQQPAEQQVCILVRH